MEDFEFTNYIEFYLYLTANEDEFELVLNYENFQVWLHYETGCYYYLERSGGKITDFSEVELCATLKYDVFNELRLKEDDTGEIMGALFDCDCCGECTQDDYKEYLWFKRIE